ncbi:MAG TPA: hypothetical protein VL461_14795 [Dictyobacter sp.]|nr:hypothetical protein [Dictyobacter sp.]
MSGCLLLAACAPFSTSSNIHTSTSTKTGAAQRTTGQIALAHLPWCHQPAAVFHDMTAVTTENGGGTATAFSNWNDVKAQIGFTWYLPASLPAGSCLLSATGTIHDPLFGSELTVSYILPGQNSLVLSQTPMTQPVTFQCSITDKTPAQAMQEGNPTALPSLSATVPPTSNALQVCNGVRMKTSIVFSSEGATATLQRFFQSLQPDVAWVPAA